MLKFSGVPESERQQGQEAAVAELQQSLNLSDGPLLRIGLIELGEAAGTRLLVVIHHLVVEWGSWGILLADFELASQQLSDPEIKQFAAATLPKLREHQQAARELAQSKNVSANEDSKTSEPRR